MHKPYGASLDDSIWKDPFSPFVLFTFSSCMEFVLTYVYALNDGVYATARTKTAGLEMYYLHYAFCAFLLFYTAWVASFSLSFNRSLKRSSVVVRQKISTGVMLICLSAIIALFLLLLLTHPQFGESRMLLVKGAYGYLFALAQVTLLSIYAVTAVVLLTQYQLKTHSRVQRVRLLLTLIFCLTLVFVTLGLLQGRGRAFSVIILTLMIWHYTQNRLPLMLYLSILMIGVVAAIWISMSNLNNVGYRPAFVDVAFGVQYKRNFDGLYNAATMIWHMLSRGEGIDYGASIIKEIIADLQPSDDGQSGTRSFFMEEVLQIHDIRAGVALSKVGEFYRAGGLIGVVVGGGLLGCLAKLLYVQFARRQILGAISIPLYSFLMAGLGVATIRGYFGGKIILAIALACVFLFIAFVFVNLEAVDKRRGGTGPQP
jgi:hypothetical protein